ncbi:hypothetical protein ACQP00_42345 [Dactylosporangium sp. CS-047395]|uniref:hypothetical protein n=1 Tax=Dactylosporangium sp. CS-047395 TaxID=3239936 RepID=UPI003D8F50F7
MEPENGQDQVNGSPPPKPKSRRGWMSDSPLDGGSGWPTSAYAIVPRQPTPAAEKPPAEPPVDPPVEPVVEESAPEPAPSRKGRIGLLVIGLIVLVVAAVGAVLATRDKSDNKSLTDSATTAAPDPTTQQPALPVIVESASASVGTTSAGAPAAGPTSGDPSAGASPSGTGTVPAAPPSTGILRTGTAQFVVLAGQPDDAFDFDSGSKQATGADATAGAIGITAANGAKFAVLLTADTPSLAACTAVPESRWVSQVVIGSLVPGARVCVRTSENRYAWFMTRAGELVTGALYTSNVDFVVYKKDGD